MSSHELRKDLASLSLSEKVKIVEKLPDRSIAIAAGSKKTPRSCRGSWHSILQMPGVDTVRVWEPTPVSLHDLLPRT